MDHHDKDAIIEQLQEMKTTGDRLVHALKSAGRDDHANVAEAIVETLGARIDDLVAQSTTEWAGDAAALIGEMRSTNRWLEAYIPDVEKNGGPGPRAVEALGRLDGATVAAAKILSQF